MSRTQSRQHQRAVYRQREEDIAVETPEGRVQKQGGRYSCGNTRGPCTDTGRKIYLLKHKTAVYRHREEDIAVETPEGRVQTQGGRYSYGNTRGPCTDTSRKI